MRRAAAAVAIVAALAGCGGSGKDTTEPRLRPADGTLPPVALRPQRHVPAVIPGTGALVAYVRRGAILRTRPNGPRLVRVSQVTEWGSSRVLSVVGRSGDWVRVLVPELPNGRSGWLDARRAKLYRVPYSLEILVSRRLMLVRRSGRVIARTPVAVGRPGAPTPPGRFAVTDKLRVTFSGSPYGCCILALTGHQTRVPQGWGGGDRLAIHSTNAPETIGQAASLGCIRAPTPLMRRLINQIPIGAPVFIRA